ncbi:hypothetical protein [Leifsonia sp. 2MCAF36]|uniref:hypothetical protein n=1 Tax=Leifsonia sp. 2MCAF36 TaxID=3232988 RepID=UPI003F9E289C
MSEAWVANHGCRVVAQESARLIDEDDAVRLERAAKECGVSRLLAVVNDDHFIDPTELVFSVKPTVAELMECNVALVGLNAVLFSERASVGLVATVDDFSVLAAPPQFARIFEPDPSNALSEFRAFAMTQPRELRPAAVRALRLFEKYA